MSILNYIYSKKIDGKYCKRRILGFQITTINNSYQDSTLLNNESEKENILLKTFERTIELLIKTNDREFQKKVLKENLSQIEVEMFSFCNRKCWFCPNSIVDRRSAKIDLKEELFIKILNNLKEIDYNGNFCFHRYNETLADKKLILKRIKTVREYLPNAKLLIATNGDYLDKEYFHELIEAGVDDIGLSYYFSNNEDFNLEKAKVECIKWAQKLELEYREKICNDNMYYANFIYPGINFEYRSQNFKNTGFSRGGSINSIADNLNSRKEACYFPFGQLFIDYDGSVMPCCHMRSDLEEHKSYIMGNINDNDLFEIFTNEKYISLRKHLYSSSIEKDGACKYCNAPSKSIILNWLK